MLLAATPTLAQTCQLAGTIAGLGNKPILYAYTRQGEQHTDTVRVRNSHFTYLAKPGDDGMAWLRIPGTSHVTEFWVEPGKVLVRGDAAQPDKIRVTGTSENQVLDEYGRLVTQKYDAYATKDAASSKKIQAQNFQATRHFITTHSTTRTSAYLLYWQMLTNQSYPLAQYEQLLKQLTPRVQQSFQGQQAAKRLLVLRSQPTVGRPVPDFTIADTAGVQHSLATYRGKYVLLDFWGHWCHPCLEAMPKVNALHQQYANKLTIIGIAMEQASSAPLWKKAIRQHQVLGLQLSELQSAEGPVISGYNVVAFPTYMLLNAKGVLVMSTNDIDDVTQKLATLADL